MVQGTSLSARLMMNVEVEVEWSHESMQVQGKRDLNEVPKVKILCVALAS
jgi:hypothetical protein